TTKVRSATRRAVCRRGGDGTRASLWLTWGCRAIVRGGPLFRCRDASRGTCAAWLDMPRRAGAECGPPSRRPPGANSIRVSEVLLGDPHAIPWFLRSLDPE